MNFGKKQNSGTVHLLQFSLKWQLKGYFAGAFNTSNVHEIWQILHKSDHLQFLYNPIWLV